MSRCAPTIWFVGANMEIVCADRFVSEGCGSVGVGRLSGRSSIGCLVKEVGEIINAGVFGPGESYGRCLVGCILIRMGRRTNGYSAR